MTPAHRKLLAPVVQRSGPSGRFVKQAFRLEEFLVDDMDAIRAWFFLIMLAFSLLFALAGGRSLGPQRSKAFWSRAAPRLQSAEQAVPRSRSYGGCCSRCGTL